jgi:hypothetical protein
MSRTLALGCFDCNVSHWIGQSQPDTDGRFFYVYLKAQPTMAKFLEDHAGHQLGVGDDEFQPFDWPEIEDDDDD